MAYVNEHVWVGVTQEEAKKDTAGKVLNGRWVLSNKTDLVNPDVRARYVACELNTFDDAAFFAATPPLEAKRLLFSQ